MNIFRFRGGKAGRSQCCSSCRTSNLQKVATRWVRLIKTEHGISSDVNWCFQAPAYRETDAIDKPLPRLLGVFCDLSPDDDFDGGVEWQFIHANGDSSVMSRFAENFSEQVRRSVQDLRLAVKTIG